MTSQAKAGARRENRQRAGVGGEQHQRDAGVQDRRSEPQHVELPVAVQALQNSQSVLQGDRARHDQDREHRGELHVVVAAAHERHDDHAMKEREQGRLQCDEAGQPLQQRPRHRRIASDLKRRCQRQPEAAELGEDERQHEEQREVAAVLDPQHPRDRDTADHQRRLTKQACRDARDQRATHRRRRLRGHG